MHQAKYRRQEIHRQICAPEAQPKIATCAVSAAGQGREIKWVRLPPRKVSQPPCSKSLEVREQSRSLSVGQQARRPKSERVKGLSPVITIGKDDAVNRAEVTTGSTARARRCLLARGRRPWHAGHDDVTATREALPSLSEHERGEYARQPHKGREANGGQGVGSLHTTDDGG